MLKKLSIAMSDYLCGAGYLIYAPLGHRISGCSIKDRLRLPWVGAWPAVSHYSQYFNRMSMQNSMR